MQNDKPHVNFYFDNIIVHPDIFVKFGGKLPPNRPCEDALIEVKNGKAFWITEGNMK